MYVLRFITVIGTLRATTRRLLKLVEATLWHVPAQEGLDAWQPGTEIRSPALAYSVLTTGTKEDVHAHERSWELYQVLQGTLRMLVKRYRSDEWHLVTLGIHDTLLLAPGTYHLLDSTCDHVTQVIQAPPAMSDRILDLSSQDVAAAWQLLNHHAA